MREKSDYGRQYHKPSWAHGGNSHGNQHGNAGNAHGNQHGNPHGNPHVMDDADSIESFSCPEIVTRKRWQAREPLHVFYTILPLEFVIVHHTVTNTCNAQRKCVPIVQSIQNYHMDDLKFDDIGYNFLIGGDGSVFEGVGWHRRGSHTYGYNSRSIGIAFMGNYENYAPTRKAVQAAKNLIECGISNYELSKDVKVFGGRQVQSTASPGENLFEDMKNWPHWAEV
ncbi:peptidoglycan recognition protein-like isoform X2 [Phlebotomus argentipes]|uniref:peptidoglycan recognition protein-like isoform X2 n=1 Tax=Phlebotomus argentipes TaxID=94469 RepID=UPI0028929F7F|nr:peptidoglycan recognition protein-like isoform X2 [Phlebotomus argentipes]